MLKQYRWLKGLALTLKVLLKTSLIRARAGRSLSVCGFETCIMTVSVNIIDCPIRIKIYPKDNEEY
jgi:hypothetical protein